MNRAIFFEINWTQSLPRDSTILLHAELDGDFFGSTEYAGDFQLTTFPLSGIIQSVQLVNDTTPESDGSITWVIRDSAEYNVNPKLRSKTVRIFDDDLPRVSIEQGSESYMEGGNGELIISTENPVTSDLLVNLNVEIVGDYQLYGIPNSVTINTGDNSASVQFEINGDNQDEPDGTLIATIVSNADYNLAPTGNTVSVKLLDTDQLRVAVASSSDAVIEGESIDFRFSSNQEPRQDIEIEFEISEQGDFLVDEAPTSITILAGRTEAFLSLQTQDDSEYESEGLVELSLVASPDYNVEQAASSIDVAIRDNDGPTMTIAGISSIVEGEDAIFIVSTSSQPLENLDVNINIVETGDFVDEILPTIVQVRAGSSAENLQLSTEDDSLDENDGTIAITILPGIGYQVNEGLQSSMTTTVTDNDTDSVVSLAAVFSTITEGQHVGFEINASTSSQVPRFIPVVIYDSSGQFLNERVETTFHLNATERNAHLSVSTLDNYRFETTGGITAEIQRGAGYTIADFPKNTATVAVLDNDAPAGFSIIALSETIAEGDMARFQITAQNAEPVARVIGIQVLNDGDYIDGSLPTSVSLAPASTTSILEFPTLNNNAELPSGEITVTIEPSADYLVASEPNNSASVYVQDREQPTLSITADSEMFEGETADFTIISSQISADTLKINLAVSETGGFLVGATEAVAIMNAGELETTYAIPINDDNLDSADGQLTVQLLDGLNYELDSTASLEATIRIKDNDPPAISLLAIDTKVIEGQSARFELQSTSPPATDLAVTLNINPENGSFIDQTFLTRVETITAGETWTRFAIATLDDQVYELAGDFTIQIASDSQYTVVEDAQTVLVAVVDNDSPILSVSTQERYNEGEAVQYLITANPIPLEDLEVNVNLTQSSSYVIASVPTQLNFPEGSITITFTVNTVDNTIDEVDGTMNFTLLNGEGYRLNPETFQTSTTITDNDHNIVSISTEQEQVFEGEDQFTNFQIKIDPPISDRAVPVTLEYHLIGSFFRFAFFNHYDRIGFGDEWKKQQQILIPAGQAQVIHRIEIEDDDEFEASGQFSVRLLNGENYTVSTTNSYTSTRIFDDDAPHGISIDPVGSDEYLEGETVVLEIRSDSVVNQNTEIYLDISETGQTISGIIPTKVTIPKGQDWVRLEIQLDDDTITESESELLVQILPNPNYSITDDYSEASISIFDNDLPIISIASLGDISEGDEALFEITVYPASPEFISVDYELSEVGDFLVSHPSQYVDLRPFQESVIVSAQTQNDDEFELNGTIIATISENYQFQVSETAGQASVNVTDDETPVGISILPDTNSITEGDYASFQIRTDSPSTITRQIGIELDRTAKQFVYSYPEFVTILPGETETSLTLRTINDTIYRSGQHIIVQLVEGLDYDIAESHQYAVVQLLDDDVPEVSIIALNEASIHEGEIAEFMISTSKPLPQNLVVNLASEIPENLTSDIIPNSIILPAGTTSTSLEIQTDADVLFEDDSEIVIELVADPAYTIKIGHDQVTIQVIDANLSTASIESNVSEVLEGQDVEFTVQLTPAFAFDEGDVRIKQEFYNDGLKYVEWKTLNLVEGDTELRYTLSISDNFQREIIKSITATLVPTWNTITGANNYRFEEESSSVEVAIIDNDSPTGISIYAEVDSILEGESAKFQLRSDQLLSENQTFQLRVFGSEELIDHAQYFDFELGANQRQSTITIPTLDDEVFSSNGIMTMAILPSSNYAVANTNTSATIKIIDNDFLPGISVVATTATVTEGDEIQFVIRAGEALLHDQAIGFQIEPVGDFIVETISPTIVLSAGLQEVVVRIPTINDGSAELAGAVTLTLTNSPEYAVTPEYSTATVRVMDNDTPLGISILPVTEYIVEGDIAEFQISTSTPFVRDKIVNILVTGTGDFFANPDGIQTATLPALEPHVRVGIPTIDNTIYQLDGAVTVTIKAGEEYLISEHANHASITVLDNDVPVISIASFGSTNLVEGEAVRFQIEASTVPLQDLSIPIVVTQTGEFLAESTPNHLVFPAGQRVITDQLNTLDDSLDELDGDISITLQASVGYSLATAPNDSMNFTISDNDLNSMSIAASSVSVTEAETASFIINSSLPVSTSFPINVTFAQTGQFINNLVADQTIIFELGEKSKQIEFILVDDEVLEDHGQLSAQLTTGNDYVIVPSPNNIAIIELLDDDTPILSITGTTPIEEGETAEFEIRSTEVATTPIQIQVSVAIDGIQVGGSLPDLAEIATGETTTIISIPTIDDSEMALAGEITITLLESSDFSLADQTQATISVNNNDFPELAISASGDVVEGRDPHAEFTITSASTLFNDLVINLAINQVGNYIGEDPIETIIMPTGETSVNILVPIQNNEIEESDGEINVAIQAGRGYQIDANNQTAQVNVTNDDIYLASINSNAPFVTEGHTINYIVELTPAAPSAGITITVNHEGEGDYVNSFTETLMFNAGDTEKTYSIQTSSEDHYTADGKVTATITKETHFSIQPGAGMIVTQIEDKDAPGGISVIPIVSTISEGETAQFQITADYSTNFERSINIAVTETGRFITNQFEIPDIVSIEANQRTAILGVETEADELIESDGQISVSVLVGENYVPASVYSTASVQVRNENQVTLSIAAVNSSVTEGLPVKLSIHSSPVAPQKNLLLTLDHDVDGDFLQTNPIHEILVTPADFNGQEAQFDIAQTLNDTVFESNGLIVTELNTGSDYLVADAPNNTARVVIVDNDEPTGIAITSVTPSVNEGNDIIFQLTASNIELSDRTINLGFSEPNSNYVVEQINQIVLPANSRSVQLIIPTQDNLINESTGEVTVTLEAGLGYEIAEEFNTASTTITDNDRPLIAIRAGEAISEAQTAEVIIQSTTISTLNITIPLEYSMIGHFAQTADFPTAITLFAGETEKTLQLPMIDDNIHEPDGQIVATLVPGAEYLIDDVEYSAAVVVSDNDLPTIAITKVADIIEGEVAEFLIAAEFAPEFDLTINLLSERLGDDWVVQSNDPFTITLIGGESTKYVSIPTTDNNQSNPDYSIEMSIGTGTGYRISDASSSDSLLVRDDDYYTIGLAIDSPTVIDGEPIHYRVSVTPNPLASELNIAFEMQLVDEFGNISESLPFQAIIDANTNNTTYSLPTTRNFRKDGHIHYFISLLPGNGYRIDPASATASVRIIDADSPVGFSIEAVNRFTGIDEESPAIVDHPIDEISIVEGESAHFAIRSHEILSTEQEIMVNITANGDFLANTQTKTVLFPVGQHIASFEVPTLDDQLIEVDGSITAQLPPSDSYEIAESPHDAASVIVYDNDQALPGVMILAQSNIVVEGEPAQFFIKSSSSFERDQPISLDVANTGDFIDDNFTNTIILPQGDSSAIFTVPTIDDQNFESAGTIDVLINQPPDNDSSYRITAEPFNAASVTVLDNDSPIGISIVPVTEVVTEGESVWFQITSTPPLTDSKTINLQLKQVGDFMAETTIHPSVHIASLNSNTLYDISTIDDQTYETDGVVSVTILPSSDYVVTPTYQSASVRILDNDLPELSITSIGPIVEGEDAEFELVSSLAPFTNLEILLAVSQEGEFIAEQAAESTIIQANTTQSTLLVTTLDDDVDEYHGSINVEILPGLGYTVATTPDNFASVAIADNDKPVISIAAVKFLVDEGNQVIFRFESSSPPDNAIPITISFTQEGDYITDYTATVTSDLVPEQSNETSDLSPSVDTLDDANGNQIVESPNAVTFDFPAEQTQAYLTLSTNQYNFDGANGTITANIDTGTDYKINQFSDSTTITIRDIDVPVISLTQLGSSEVDEGSNLTVVANTSLLSIEDLSINYAISQTGSFVEIPTRIEPLTLVANQAEIAFNVPTIDDEILEADGEVTIQLMPGSGYVVDETNYAKSFTILDNDQVTLSIDFADAESQVIQEGTTDTLQYKVTATPEVPAPGIMVNVEFTEDGASLPLDPDTNLPLTSHQIRLLPGSINEIVVLTTAPVNDNIFAVSRTVSITLVAGEGYEVAEEPNNSITVSILDDDAPQGISVLPVVSSISEAEDAVFQIYSDTEVTSDLLVNFRVTDGGDDFLGPDWPTDIVIPTGESFTELTVPITDDEDAEQAGDVSVTILGGTGYTIATTNRTASIQVTDNDSLPIVSIAPVLANINESQTAQFVITSSETSENFQSILVNVDENEDFILGNPADTVYIEANENSVIFAIELEDDDIDEADGTIFVSIDPWFAYQIDPSNNGENGTASVNVADNDETLVAIYPYHSKLDEGESVEFEFSVSPELPATGLTLDVEVTQVGEFISGSAESQVYITTLNNGFSDPMTLASTLDDSMFEINGMITATLLPRTGYTIADAPNHTATIEILDNDAPDGISILATSSTIEEGETGTFQIRTDQRSNRTRTIYLDIQSGTSDFLASPPKSWIDFAPSQWHQTLEFATIDNLIDDADRELRVRILDAPSYDVHSLQNQASIIVLDNDSPIVWVTSQESATEGETILFEFNSTISVAQDLQVNLNWEHTGNFANTSALPDSIVIPAGESGFAVEVETFDDLVVEADGTIAAQILANQYYELTDTENHLATTTVLDNDILEVAVTVADDNMVITEGPNVQAIFTINISADITNSALSIPYQLSFEGQPVSTEFQLNASQGVLSFSQGGVQTFVVDIEDDQEFEPHSTITLTLNTDQSYELAESSKSATIKVLDDDSPIGVSIVALNSIISKNETAQFQLRANQTAPNDQYISVKLTDSGRFLQGARNRIVRFPAGQVTTDFDILLNTGALLDNSGVITATLQPNASSYKVAETPNDTATITVLDEDTSAVVSIFPLEPTIIEGDDAIFRIIHSNPVIEDLEVFYHVSQVGDYLYSGANYQIPPSIVIPAGDVSVDLVLFTSYDYYFRSPGAISVELTAGDGYHILNNADESNNISKNPYNLATIKVFDDNRPSGISIIATHSTIQEGDTAQFQILAGRPVIDAREINLSIAKRGDFLSDDLPSSVIMPQFESSTFLNIATQDNGIINPDGSLEVSIQAGENYKVARVPTNRAAVRIKDNTIPVLSIAPITNTINEGEDLQFRVVSSIALPQNLLVNVSLQSTNADQNFSPTNIAIPVGATEAMLAIATADDSELHPDFEVTATLTEGPGYSIADEPDQAGSIVVMDNELPVISISSSTSSAIEGESVDFTISSQLALKSNLPVNLSVTETGDFLANNQAIAVELTPATNENTLTLDLMEDTINEADSEIVVTIDSASTYTIDPDNISATIIAHDNDQPEISISAQTTTISEDSTPMVEISANSAFYQDLSINIQMTETGDFVAEAIPTTIELATESQTTSLDIVLADDDIAEPDGMITISIAEGTNYVVAAVPNNSVTVMLQDNDELPADSIGITADLESITETRFMPFTLTASQASSNTRSINLRIGDTYPFDPETSIVYPLQFPASEQTLSFEFPIYDDQSFKPHARIYVGIDPGTGYSVSPISPMASIRVFDNDAPTGISVIQVRRVIEEGDNAAFQIRSDQSVPFDRTIAIAVTLDDVLITDPTIESVVLPANETWTTLSVPTIDNTDDNRTKTLAVSILPSPTTPSEYEVTSTYSIAEVNVDDNDLSSYFISSNTNITEGERIEFTIEATVAQNFDREIEITVSEDHDVLIGSIPSTITLPANTHSIISHISTENDTVDEPDSTITIAIVESDEYSIR